MKDIVSEALKQAEIAESQETKHTEADEFGTPEMAVVGCGEEALRWIDNSFTFRPRTGLFGKQVDFDVTTIGIGPLAETRPESAVDRVVSVQSLECNDEYFQYDLVAVVGYLSGTEPLAHMVETCQNASEETLVISFPVIPTDGLSTVSISMFQQLVSISGTTIPFDLAQVSDASGGQDPTEQSTLAPILSTTFGRIRGVLRDIFELFQEPIAVPADMAAMKQIFETGETTVLYWGNGTRQTSPEEMLQDAVSNRSSECDVDTVDRGITLFRFGASFELAEFENLHDYIATRYQSSSAGQTCWQTAGFVTQGFGDQCRIILLLTGIELESFTSLKNV